MKKNILYLLFALSMQSISIQAMQNIDFDFKNETLINPHTDSNITRSKHSHYHLPKVGESLIAYDSYYIDSSGILHSDRTISLTVLARYPKKGFYKINVSNQDSLNPDFSHDFVISKIDNTYYGYCTDGTAFDITLIQHGKKLEMTYSYLFPLDQKIGQAHHSFRLNN